MTAAGQERRIGAIRNISALPIVETPVNAITGCEQSQQDSIVISITSSARTGI
jgi:hypothetical protein